MQEREMMGGEMTERAREAGDRAAETVSRVGEMVEDVPTSIYYAAVGASILASLLLFLRGRKWESLFVGLWAPTILNMTLSNKLLRPSQEVRQLREEMRRGQSVLTDTSLGTV